MITCAMCGLSFDPQGREVCQSCPLTPSCQLVCCPNCGYENVNPERSTLVRLARRWGGMERRFRKRRGPRFNRRARLDERSSAAAQASLADVIPGSTVILHGYRPGLSQQQQSHLRAYGLTEGSCLSVVQRQPVMVVKVEHTELAIELDLARAILVTAPSD